MKNLKNIHLSPTEQIAIVTAIAFTCSAAYVYGASTVIGVNLLQYLSLTDYPLIAASKFAPGFIALLPYMLSLLFYDRIRKAYRDDLRAERSRGSLRREWLPPLLFAFRLIAMLILVGVAATYLPTAFGGPEPGITIRSIIHLAVSVGWFFGVRWLFGRSVTDEKGNVHTIIAFITLGPLFLFTFFVSGYKHGERSVAGNVPSVVIHHDNDTLFGRLLFTLANGVILMRDSSKGVTYVPTDYIDYMREYRATDKRDSVAK